MVNFDAMRQAEDEAMNKHLEEEEAYITKEMIDPLIGCKVVRGYVDRDDFDGQPIFSNPFPVLVFQREDGLEMHFAISADDECNEGGRLLQVR
jgi:hypothetical protein